MGEKNSQHTLRLGYILFVTSLLFAYPKTILAKPKLGLFISDQVPLSRGFLYLGLEIQEESEKKNFLAQELRYHPELGWEELIYTGNWKEERGTLYLNPNSCQVRASKSFGEKKGLLRRFDCQHLMLSLSLADSGFTLSTNLSLGLERVPLPHYLPELAGEPVALSFPLPDNQEMGIWGFHLTGIGKKDPVQVWSQKGKRWAPFRGFLESPNADGAIFYRWRRTFSD